MTDLDDLTRLQSDLAIPDESYACIAEALLDRGQSAGAFLGLGTEQLATIYQVAHHVYDSGDYVQAEKIFGLLCLMDGTTFAHWLGLGNCRQMLGLHDEAQAAYRMAVLQDSEDPRPYLQSAVSWIALGERESAREALKDALARAEIGSADPTAIRERATRLQHWIDAPTEPGVAGSQD